MATLVVCESPNILVQQRERDLQGHGISLRPSAERGWEECWTSQWSSTKLTRSCMQITVSFDRLLSDESRCTAYTSAIDAAIYSGAKSFAFLGVGSLLPAFHAARKGAQVAIVEPCAPLAAMARRGIADNQLRIAIVAQVELLRSAWGRAPDVLVSERIDEGLLAEGILPQLSAAARVLGPPSRVLPRSAAVTAVAVQLGFEGVDGFGLDGLGIDMRHFDALRPHGAFTQQPPGYWPVRLLPARQPHRRLSEPLPALVWVHFEELVMGRMVDSSEEVRERLAWGTQSRPRARACRACGRDARRCGAGRRCHAVLVLCSRWTQLWLWLFRATARLPAY